LTGARNVPIFFSPFEKTKPIQGAVGRGFERLAGARDFSVSGAGVGICELLKMDFASKKARNRDDTLADLIEVSMGTPRFRTIVPALYVCNRLGIKEKRAKNIF
jgi:hypothetical protein